ncbi:MAG: PIN domain-containing protein [Planctomycetia bacterium]|nr:PIN domain-containing protein [Planctomycetia bacterium]
MVETLVVDANPLLSALLGGQAREVLFSGKIVFFSSQHTLFEVEKYLPSVAKRIGCAELDLWREFQLLPVIAVQPREYDSELPRAIELIGQRDPKDVHVLALALRLDLPIWTDDRDFEGLPHVSIHKTADLLVLIAS